MIFVTVGTHSGGFDRLVKAADELASETREPVIVQRGSTQYRPNFAIHFEWANSQRMEELYKEARVVITHAAAGAIILALRMQKPIIVVPRLRIYKENTNDHQCQIAKALSEQGRAVYVVEPTAATLKQAIEQAMSQNKICTDSSQLIIALQQQLSLWDPDTNRLATIQEKA